MASSGLRALYLDASAATVCLDGQTLRIGRRSKADQLVPLRHVGRAVIRNVEDNLLEACLALVRKGGTVHFQDPDGRIRAVLHQPRADGCKWARDLANLIEHHSGCAPFDRWRETQQRHAWSLVFRRGYRGGFNANRTRLKRYLIFFRPEASVCSELNWLEEQLWAWLQAELNANGLQPVIRALSGKGCDLIGALHPCLSVPLLWTYVRWRRLRDDATQSDLACVFELQAAAPLRDQLQRHLQALAGEYHVAIRLESVDDEWDEYLER